MKKEKINELNNFYQPKKQNKPKKKKDKPDEPEQNNDIFNFDNEIVIGVTKKEPIEPKRKKKKKKSKLTTNSPKENEKKNQVNPEEKLKKIKDKKPHIKLSPKQEKKRRKRKIIIFIIKWIVLIGITITAMILFLLSPVFNIEKIEVVDYEIIPEATYISLSQITLGQNIYKINEKDIKNNIKQNPYVDDVTIERVLPNVIRLKVVERKPTFMLEIDQNYMYINNQGYMLELTNKKLNKPIITGYKTKSENIRTGNRLEKEDLPKLETVLKIIEVANSNDLYDNIKSIDITNANNYTLILNDGKIAYLGDATNLTRRISLLKSILQQEEGKQGEVFVDGDMNQKKGYFREKI